MNNMIVFLIGVLSGGWSCSYMLNRYYRSDIWQALKKLRLEELHVQQKRKEAQRTRYEREIDDLLRQRTKG